MQEFKDYLQEQNKSINTIENYTRNIENFRRWYTETTGEEMKKIYRPNVLDYKSYLRNIKKTKKGQPLKAETINANLSAIMQYNKFLVAEGVQTEIVLCDNDFIKIQKQHINPCKVNTKDIESFRQKILENETKRDYAIVTVIIYIGLRISECLNIGINDFDFNTKEIIIRNGKRWQGANCLYEYKSSRGNKGIFKREKKRQPLFIR